ncbi:hypothetical protein L0128_05450 [candidate division KSB1 bacterium]|nr:hypothetical protein [candidate division KSB1 bacterium]
MHPRKIEKLTNWIWSLLLAVFLLPIPGLSLDLPDLTIVQSQNDFRPLEPVTVKCVGAGTLSVKDATGREYVNIPAKSVTVFHAGGAAGKQTIALIDKKGKILASTSFNLLTETVINDEGRIKELFEILKKGMFDGNGEVTWKGKRYHYYVPWVLDHNNVMSGMQYFLPYGNEFTDLMRAAQREDGMIWSFVDTDKDAIDYYKTAYSPIGFFKEDNAVWFVRQPVENHPEYNYVNMFYKHWKASGDTKWMQATLESAVRALDYCVTDSIRWSQRFQLLKRPYCIDSWDFQVDDEYTPSAPISPSMVVVPGQTKYGIFFGDNTGYHEACLQLAEMYEFTGQIQNATKFRNRAQEILKHLIELAWNGHYFTHFIDEDSTVKRNLGVDEKSQIAQGNMYSLNRGLPHALNVAIIETYQNLRKNLPEGSPGEWYAIYPPFERGFGTHNSRWQYMNGGVAGHAIGEMARGAYENGYEDYASDVILRTVDLVKKGQNRLWFAYTGAMPASPPRPNLKIVDISSPANMDLRDLGGKGVFKWMNDSRPGNDMRGLPTGDQTFNQIQFRIIDPGQNQCRAVIGLAYKPGFPRLIEVPVNDQAAAVYLLHSSSDNTPSEFAGAITFHYADGTEKSRNIVKHRDVTNWWFPRLENERAGVAWAGPNPVSTRVGVCWAAIDNPEPDKKIKKLIFHAPIEGGIYAILGITLADRQYYVKPKFASYGGPDNWAAANVMAALVEGLAGVKNQGLAFDQVKLSPRWCSAGIDTAAVTIQLPASGGYVSYHYVNDALNREIRILLTGSGETVNGHVLLPGKAISSVSVSCNGTSVPAEISTIEKSRYADFSVSLKTVQHIVIRYN